VVQLMVQPRPEAKWTSKKRRARRLKVILRIGLMDAEKKGEKGEEEETTRPWSETIREGVNPATKRCLSEDYIEKGTSNPKLRPFKKES